MLILLTNTVDWEEHGRNQTSTYTYYRDVFGHEVLHNRSGPAHIFYYKSNKQIAKELYMVNGLYHRQNGPARIEYDEDGNITKQKYYIKDTEYTEEEFKLRFFAGLNNEV